MASAPPKCDIFSRPPRLQEMRFYYHLVAVTRPTLIKDEIDENFWKFVFSELATSYDYVMDGLLAIGVLHLASLDSEPQEPLLYTALNYHNRAVRGLRQNLLNTTLQTYEPALICSIAIIIFVTGYSGISQQKDIQDPLERFVGMRSLVKGFLFLQKASLKSNEESESRLDEWLHQDRTVKLLPSESR
jgi:hypothetical protein